MNSAMRYSIQILAYIRPHWHLFTLSFIFTLLFAASNVYIMPLIRDITTEVTNKNLGYFSNHILNAFALFSIRLFTKYAQVYVMEKASYKIMIQIREALFTKLQHLSLDFYTKWKPGEIISRAISDTEKIKTVLHLNFESLLPNALTIIAVIGYLFYINWELALFSIAGVPFFAAILAYFSKRLRRVSKQIQQKTADITHLFQENISNIKIVQLFATNSTQFNRFKKQQQRNYMAFIKEIQFKVIQEPLIALMQFVIFLAILWYGGFLVVNNEISGPTLMSFFTGIVLLVEPVMVLSRVYSSTYQATASMERINDILTEPVPITSPEHPHPWKTPKGHITFQNVSFKYINQSQYALEHISFTANPGDSIALVGPSGAGKSSLVNLIPRFYDPESGLITIDTIPIQHLNLNELRSQIALVPQEDLLFRGTILENIRFGNKTATVDDVTEALKKANALEFVNELPEGLLTKVGSQGFSLSGGQRQRLSIARAILKKPKILLLDEATSALDSASEKIVQNALDTLINECTTFIIAHRLSTIINATKIIYIDQGKIIQTGTHAELSNQPGPYQDLLNKQFSYDT